MNAYIPIIAAVMLLASCSYSQNNTPVSFIIPRQTPSLTAEQLANGKKLNIRYQIRGFCYAYSSKKNAIPSNGEWQSDNVALPAEQQFSGNQFSLIIDPNEYALSENNNMLMQKLYVINKTDTLMEFEGQDSRLKILPEAMDKDGTWKLIGYSPNSWCGNSYHTIRLDKNEYWSFNIPVFDGNFKTKLRYCFYMKDKKYTSNEITASINRAQFDTKKQEGHTATDIMDPYNN